MFTRDTRVGALSAHAGVCRDGCQSSCRNEGCQKECRNEGSCRKGLLARVAATPAALYRLTH
jgi:hypothetical protein